MTRNEKITLGVVGGIGIAWWISRNVSAAVIEVFPGGEEPEDPNDPATVPPGPATPQVESAKVPRKGGGTGYNVSMFPSKLQVQARLAGLSFGYVGASNEATWKATVGAFQADWNTLADLRRLDPDSLNSTRLLQDEVPGPQTLRALEWAIGMDWPKRLIGAGLQP
jgi:hypothetical protein